MITKTFPAGEHLIAETLTCDLLTIEEGAKLVAPENHTLLLSVDGYGRRLVPGVYGGGNVVLAVVAYTNVKTEGIFGNPNGMNFRAAVSIKDGKIVEAQSDLALVNGEISDTAGKDVTIVSTENYLNGIVLMGKSEFTLDNAYIELEGEGGNDFSGLGSPIMVLDDSVLTVNNSKFITHGLTRTTTHSAGNSVIHYNNCEFQAISAPCDFFFPVWCLGLSGTNRATQIAGYGKVFFNDCKVTSNGWGALCIDGADRGIMEAHNSEISLVGPRGRGYAAFPERHSSIRLFDCKVRSNGYGFLMDTHGEGGGGYYSNTNVKAEAFGVFVFKDRGGEFKADNGTVIASKRASFRINASNTFINLDNVSLKPANGRLVQLDDCDVGPMDAKGIALPVGEVDVYVEGRDLTTANPQKDVFLNWKNMDVAGDILNSSTNLDFVFRPFTGEGPDFNMYVIDPFSKPAPGGPGHGPGPGGPGHGPGGDDDGPKKLDNDEDANPDMEFFMDETVFYGPRNLEASFENVKIQGVISSATQAYKEGLEVIRRDNLMELGNITQTPAPAVNNGVIVKLGAGSVWTVTGKSYINRLVIDPAAQVVAAKMTVNGVETPIAAGEYVGTIIIE